MANIMLTYNELMIIIDNFKTETRALKTDNFRLDIIEVDDQALIFDVIFTKEIPETRRILLIAAGTATQWIDFLISQIKKQKTDEKNTGNEYEPDPYNVEKELSEPATKETLDSRVETAIKKM